MQKLITISIFEGFFSVIQTAMVCDVIVCANLFELENKMEELLQTNDEILLFLFYRSEQFSEYQKIFNKFRPSEKVIRCLVFEKFDKKFVQKHQFSPDSVDYYFSAPVNIQMIKEIKENLDVIKKIQAKKDGPDGNKELSDKERQNLMEAVIEADHIASKTRANFEIPKLDSIDEERLKKIIDSHLIQLDAYKMDAKIQAIQNLFDDVKDIAFQKNSKNQIVEELEDNRTVVISASTINSLNQNNIENKGDIMSNSKKTNEDSTSLGISFSVLEEESNESNSSDALHEPQTMVMKRPDNNQLSVSTDNTQPTHNGLVIDDDENYSLDAEVSSHSNSEKTDAGLRLDAAAPDDMEFELNPSSTKSSFTQTDELKIDAHASNDLGLSLGNDDDLSVGDDIGSVDFIDEEIPSFQQDALIDDDMPPPPPIKNKTKSAIVVKTVEEDDDLFSIGSNEDEIAVSKSTYENYDQSGDADDVVVDSGRSLGILRAMKDERAILLQEIKQLKKENQLLKSENITLASEFEEMKIEKEILRKRTEEKLSHLEYKLTMAEDKKLLLEAKNKEHVHEIKILRQSGHLDGQNIRKREKELEQKLEMLKIDSDSQVQSRDKKILDLKRKLDALEFNMESMSNKEQQLREEKSLLEDKVNKIMKVLRKSIDDIDTESEIRDNEILKRLKRA